MECQSSICGVWSDSLPSVMLRYSASLFSKMPRKGKQLYRPYSAETIEEAIAAVRAGQLSQRAAARHYQVPQSTISNHLTGVVQPGAKPGRPPVIPEKIEKELVDRCQDAEKCGFGVSRIQLMARAGQLCKKLNIKTPFKNDVPGIDWFAGLKRRNPDLVLRSPEPLSDVRCKALNPTVVGQYFVELGRIMSSLDLHQHPEKIWNMDETGSRLDHKPTKVCARKGSNVVSRVGNSRDSVSVLVSVNAVGRAMPSMVIVKGCSPRAIQAYNTAVFPAVYTYQKKAYMEDVLGEEWFANIFLANCGPGRPQLLILDGHHSHEVTGLLQRAREEDIHIIALHPHSTSKLCPLDVSCFAPLKRSYSKSVTEWMAESPANVMSKWVWPTLFGKAYDAAITTENITSGFRRCGIVPYSPRAIRAEDFKTSMPFDKLPQDKLWPQEHPLEWVYLELQTNPSPPPPRCDASLYEDAPMTDSFSTPQAGPNADTDTSTIKVATNENSAEQSVSESVVEHTIVDVQVHHNTMIDPAAPYVVAISGPVSQPPQIINQTNTTSDENMTHLTPTHTLLSPRSMFTDVPNTLPSPTFPDPTSSSHTSPCIPTVTCDWNREISQLFNFHVPKASDCTPKLTTARKRKNTWRRHGNQFSSNKSWNWLHYNSRSHKLQSDSRGSSIRAANRYGNSVFCTDFSHKIRQYEMLSLSTDFWVFK